jgi:cytochrome c peroxidase
MALFKAKANCIACHNGPNFTDSGFHNVGLAHNPALDDEAHQKVLRFDAKRTKNPDWETMTEDPGRYLITHQEADWGRFKTPTLRNLADTPPYMHDGRYRTLEEVIAHYDRGGDGARNQDPRIRPLGLSDGERQDLIAFLAALRGPLPEINMADWVRAADSGAGLDGKALFEGKATCVNCHQPDGQGVPGVFPPLAGNPHVAERDGSYVARTIIHGRGGELRVRNRIFNAVMPPIGTQQGLTDAEIAAVASYVRNAWGNQGSPVTEETVARQR